MTLSATAAVNRYIAAEGQLSFPYSFKLLDDAHLQVFVGSDSLTSGYTITGLGSDTGGNVIFAPEAVPRAVGEPAVTVTLRRSVPLDQVVDLPAQGSISSVSLEESGLDRIVMQVQQLSEVDERAFKLPVSSSLSGSATELAPVAGKFIGWNATGDGLTNYAAGSLGEGIVPTAFGETLLATADAQEARMALDAAPSPSIVSALTIAAGSLSGSGPHLVVAAETGVSDELDTLETANYAAGEIAWLRADAGDTITVTTAGNFLAPAILNEQIATPFMLVGSTWCQIEPAYLSRSLFIGATANGKMDTGLTINQGAADNEILCLKSSDVGHGITNMLETDSYGALRKVSASGGGLYVRGYTGGSVQGVLVEGGVANAADTAKSTGANGIVEISGLQKSGADASGSLDADSNVVCLKRGGITLFIVDENGDYYYDGTSGGAFDSFRDAELLRAFALETSEPDQILRTGFDSLVRYGRAELEAARIIGQVSEEERARGVRPLVNGAQLQRLLVGAVWQLHEQIHILRERLDSDPARQKELPA